MNKKPVIGITSSYVDHNHYMKGVYVHQDYHKAVVASGGIPLVLPYTNSDMIDEYLSMCDGFILSGGEDVDPLFYNQDPHQNLGFVNPHRDVVEIQLIQKALPKGKPLFGICRGLQILNVTLGGTLIQDIPSQAEDSMQHVQTIPRPNTFHSVEVDKESFLYEIFESKSIRVNSLHHQAIQNLSSDLKVLSVAGDGIIEAVQHKELPNVFAVQWHPESMYEHSVEMRTLFQYFIDICKK